ncbi:hypothetical protein [Aquitalea sp. ASV11]|uniref:hypothetical protein n=1 Tax=Aquitalea sp. ASV11 TaxID=2795103 RepID=UPI0018EE278F|nr:hypothetical protein [Aquitalea sp. ASV11]
MQAGLNWWMGCFSPENQNDKRLAACLQRKGNFAGRRKKDGEMKPTFAKNSRKQVATAALARVNDE